MGSCVCLSKRTKTVFHQPPSKMGEAQKETTAQRLETSETAQRTQVEDWLSAGFLGRHSLICAVKEGGRNYFSTNTDPPTFQARDLLPHEFIVMPLFTVYKWCRRADSLLPGGQQRREAVIPISLSVSQGLLYNIFSSPSPCEIVKWSIYCFDS